MMPFATSPAVSPESDRTTGKPNITESNLREHGIEYDSAILGCRAADETSIGALPQYINGVREYLSDFTRVMIHQDLENFLKHELLEAMKQQDFAEITEKDPWSLSPPTFWTSAFPDHDDTILRDTVIKQMNECRDVAKEAIGLREASEADWMDFLRQHLFRKSKATKRTRETVDHIRARWCLAENLWWTNHARAPKPQGERLTAPKPDLTYGFAIYKSLSDLPKAAANMEVFRNFSADTIRRLNGPPWKLKASLTTRIHSGDLKNCQSSDTICFPWAVIEVKLRQGGQSVRDRCYRQAANASATALDIMTRLFEEPTGHFADDLPPIIAFTCTGPELRLWLTFWEVTDNRKVKKMVCIWATHLELSWGVFAARYVIDQMTKWATQDLRHSISHRLTLTTNKLPFPREIGPATPLREVSITPSPSVSTREQGGGPQPIAPKTPLPIDKSTRDLTSKPQTPGDGPACTPLSNHDRSCVERNIPAQVFSPNQPLRNKASEPAASAPKPFFQTTSHKNPWERIVPIHPPFSSIPIPEKTRETASAAQAHGFVSSMSKGSSSENFLFQLSASKNPATQDRRQPVHSPSSPNMPGVARNTQSSEGSFKVDQRTSSRSADEPSSRKQGPEAAPSSQGGNASPTSICPISDPNDDNTSPTPRKLGEKQEYPQEEEQNLPPQPDSVAMTAGRPDLLECRGLRYHDYRNRRKVGWSWTSVMSRRLGARYEDADGSVCSEDTSDSDYSPSEPSDAERQLESEDSSDSAPEEVWETQSRDDCHGNRQIECDSQSEYGISEYQDDGERYESGNGSSEHWESEDEDENEPSHSEYASSNSRDDEMDRYTVPDISEGQQSAFEDDTDPDTGDNTDSSDEDDRISMNTGRNPQRRRPQHRSLLKGADVEGLRSMALSTLCGEEFAELPLIQSMIHFPDRVPMAWTVAFWCHQKFKPTPSVIRDALVRDLNRCPALRSGDANHSSSMATVDLTFDELRRSPIKEKLIRWFTDEDGDVEVQRRICRNLIRLTEAPYCAIILDYAGFSGYIEEWNRLGEEALQYLYDSRALF